MNYKLRYSPRAQTDMDDVWDGVFEASGDTETADRYVDDLVSKISGMKKAPKTGIPLYYRGLFTGFYSVNFKAYKAFYRIYRNYVEIIRILPSRSDYITILFGDDQTVY